MPKKKKYPKKFIELLKSVTAKRAKTVIDHILKYGLITTEDLKDKYGYDHPPRAIRDVKEYGIPIVMFRVEGSDNKKIAAYKFGDPKDVRFAKLSGRTALSKKLKEELIKKYGCKCFIYMEQLDERDLQIDHRIPFEIAGDSSTDKVNVDNYMLLSGSANRAKSWSCEHCDNWKNKKSRKICLSCYWAFPEKYTHIAMKQIRRVDLLWQGAEVKQYEKIKKRSSIMNKEIQKVIKEVVEKEIKEDLRKREKH